MSTAKDEQQEQQEEATEGGRRPQDPEVRIINKAVQLLDDITSPASRRRIVNYLRDRFADDDRAALADA